MSSEEAVIENQIFIGVPWKDVRPKFEKAISDLQAQYPVHCVVFGRNTGQAADDLWHSIQKEIRASAATIFDVTGSNPNVALEFGYAEALGKRRVLTRYDRKPRKGRSDGSKQSPEPSSIMSDLAGKIRVPYKNVTSLKKALQKEFERNPFVVRFDNLVKTKHWGKRDRKVAVGVIQKLVGGKQMKKADLILAVQTDFPAMTSVDVPGLVTELKKARLLATKRGPKGGVRLRCLKV